MREEKQGVTPRVAIEVGGLRGTLPSNLQRYHAKSNISSWNMKYTHQLTVTRLAFLALRSMDESGSFCVETVKTIGLFVDKSVILRNKLPADFRRDYIVVHWCGI